MKNIVVNDPRVVLSGLWTVLIVNMIFNDIYGIIVELDKFARPELPGDAQTLMLVAAFVTNIPIMMIFFSRVLRYAINRPLNIGAAVFTILYVWGGMSTYPHYIAVAAIETVLALLIIRIAWGWKEEGIGTDKRS
jgi:hypothetical protein